MEKGLKILIGVIAFGVISLIVLIMALTPAAKVTTPETGGNVPIELGSGNSNGEVQIVDVKALGTGFYDKQEIHVKAGVPVRFRFTAERSAGCGMQLVIPNFGVNMVSRNGETVEATFTPQKGVYPYRCGMNMFRGKLYAD